MLLIGMNGLSYWKTAHVYIYNYVLYMLDMHNIIDKKYSHVVLAIVQRDVGRSTAGQRRLR